MFTAKFQPAKNKAGLSKLTYIGNEVLEGEKDGKPWSMFKLKFSCMGKFHGTHQEVNLSTGFAYEPDNLLGKTLAAFGFTIPEPETVEDEDGFEIVAPENLDEDGFEVVETPTLNILEFLEEKVGTVFVAQLYKNERHFWALDVDTLKPITKKS